MVAGRMNEKKLYIWKLATFLHSQEMVMSGEELAEHLNRNQFLTIYGTEYQGGRGKIGRASCRERVLRLV